MNDQRSVIDFLKNFLKKKLTQRKELISHGSPKCTDFIVIPSKQARKFSKYTMSF